MRNFKEQITKNQHIIPQRHLKNFLAKNSVKLECLNIDELRIKKAQFPKSICKGKFHYALTPGEYDEYSQRVEKAFGYIEAWYGDIIDRIKELLIVGQVLSDEDRYNISTVIANFYFRGCKHREETKKASIDLVNWAFPNNQVAKKNSN